MSIRRGKKRSRLQAAGENGTEKAFSRLSQDNLFGATSTLFEQLLEEVFLSKREFIVRALAKKIEQAFANRLDGSNEETNDGWVQIESLSRLRSVVGGRFQNLKERWVAAGFPLKHHRGDSPQEFTLSEEGWIEISNWILKQGYEVRLTPNKAAFLFELRPTKST